MNHAHLKKGKKFGRSRRPHFFFAEFGERLIRAGHIETTEARAKAVRPIVESSSRSRSRRLAGRRLIASRVQNQRITKKLAMISGRAMPSGRADTCASRNCKRPASATA